MDMRCRAGTAARPCAALRRILDVPVEVPWAAWRAIARLLPARLTLTWGTRGNPAAFYDWRFQRPKRRQRNEMNRRDQELLDKQLWSVSAAPRRGGALSLAFLAVFLAGLSAGGFLFANANNPAQVTAAHDPMVVLSLLNGAPPTLR
jgi:hypothetical protein